MAVLQEFRKFAVRGNVVDMAVGIVVGAAFTKIVSSLVADVVTPPIGLLVGGVDFSQLALTLREAVGDRPAIVVAYGRFLQQVFDFVLVAFAVFWLVKGINRLRQKQEQQARAAPPPPPPQPSPEVQLLTEIRDLLKARG